MRILTPEEIRNEERKANSAGLGFYEMMESAGKGCAEKIATLTKKSGSAVILCGKGKNGGDGFVIARYLFAYGYNVTVIRMFDADSDALSEQMAIQLPKEVITLRYPKEEKRAVEALKKADAVVDAIFGIGFTGDLPEYISEFFMTANGLSAIRYAVDIPSGLSAKKSPEKNIFKADYTLSMLCFKHEHIYMPWSKYCGRVYVIPIGFTTEYGELISYSREEIRQKLPLRPFNSHKGTFGHALIVAGSRDMPGAAVLATKGALSSGAGLVTLAFPDCCYGAVTAHLTDNIMMPLSTAEDGSISHRGISDTVTQLGKYSAIAVGCGMTSSANTQKNTETLISHYNGTLIIDADGINTVSRNINILKKASADIVITPHPAEMARLIGSTAATVNAAREKTAAEFAKEYGVTVLLKGVNTVVASPDGKVYINPTGSSALSRGGSGDMLTGIVASLAAQGLSAFDAACIGAYIHGLAGTVAEEKFTSFAASSERILSCIPEAFLKIIG